MFVFVNIYEYFLSIFHMKKILVLLPKQLGNSWLQVASSRWSSLSLSPCVTWKLLCCWPLCLSATATPHPSLQLRRLKPPAAFLDSVIPGFWWAGSAGGCAWRPKIKAARPSCKALLEDRCLSRASQRQASSHTGASRRPGHMAWPLLSSFCSYSSSKSFVMRSCLSIPLFWKYLEWLLQNSVHMLIKNMSESGFLWDFVGNGNRLHIWLHTLG